MADSCTSFANSVPISVVTSNFSNESRLPLDRKGLLTPFAVV